MSDSPSNAKPKRRWLQFSLRTFFVLVTVFAVWFGWHTHQAREQRKAVVWVEEMGGYVLYDYQFAEGERLVSDAEPPGHELLRDILGIHFLVDVVVVAMENESTAVDDLTPLGGLKDLETLYLRNVPVSDLTPLAELTNLQVLFLNDTQVSEEEIMKLQQALPNLKIEWSPNDHAVSCR